MNPNRPPPHSHMPRRSFLGLGLGGVITALTGLQSASAVERATRGAGRAKRVLVLFEQGGVSHIDTFDPKPDAPSEHRSPFKTIKTSVPGMNFTELLAK